MKTFDLDGIKKYANLRRFDKKWLVIVVALIGGLVGGTSIGASYSVNFDLGSDIDSLTSEKVGFLFAVLAIVAIVAAVVSFVMSLFLGNVVAVGTSGWMHRHYRSESPRIAEVFGGFSRYWHTVGTMALRELKVFLWSCLFVVPGIVAALRYSMVPYILADNRRYGRNMSASEVLRLSDKMTDGHKWDLFVLDLSFIGWQMLNALTFGILGVFFVNPYYMLTVAGAYEWLRTEAIRDGLLPPDPAAEPEPQATTEPEAQATTEPEPQVPAEPEPAVQVRYCIRCGTAVRITDNFCPACGQSIL
jgi:uncharacterized membrane protein